MELPFLMLVIFATVRRHPRPLNLNHYVKLLFFLTIFSLYALVHSSKGIQVVQSYILDLYKLTNNLTINSFDRELPPFKSFLLLTCMTDLFLKCTLKNEANLVMVYKEKLLHLTLL